MKEKNQKSVSQKSKKATRNKTIWQEPYQRDKYLGCSHRKILGAILEEEETTEELKQMDQSTRKIMTMHKDFHPRDEVDRQYVSRKEGGRGPTSIEDSVDASIQRLDNYIQKPGRRLCTATKINTDNKRTNRTEIIRKQKWEVKTALWMFYKLIHLE